MRFSLSMAAFCVALAPQVAVGTEQPTASLRYTRGAGAERCPNAETLRSAVAARLGRDPWDQAAACTIIVAIAREGAGLRARVELRAGNGRVTGLREMTSVGQDCIELAAAVQLAISLAIDPLSFTRPAKAASLGASAQTIPGAAADRVEARRAEKPAPPAVAKTPAEQDPGLRVEISLGGLAALGSAPSVAGGFALQGRLRWGKWSAALEGRIDLPAYQEIPGGEVSSSLLMAGGLGCLHVRSFFGCGLAYVGALRAAGHDVPLPRRTTLLYAAAGARLGFEIPLYSVLSLRLSGDLLATLTRITLRESGGPAEYWTTPPLSGAFGAAAVGRFR